MFLHLTSTQQRRADAESPTRNWRMPACSPPQLEGRRKAIHGSGRTNRTASAPAFASEARAAIVAKMRELDRAVTAMKLHAELDGPWSLEAIEYHLAVLVRARVVEMVLGAEIQFGLVGRGGVPKGFTGKRCR